MADAARKTILVTGSSSGIGAEVAKLAAHNGYNVAVNYASNAEGGKAVADYCRQQGVEAICVGANVADDDDCRRLATAVKDAWGRIDVLVNNAGYLGNAPATSADGLEMHFAVNVLAPWRLAHALLPALEAGEHARVVNVTGGDKPAAVDVEDLQAEKGFRGLMTYTHSKSILESMSMVLARELEPHNVGVHIVFPGRASTAMTRSLTSAGLPGAMKLMMPFFKLFFWDDGGKSASKAARSTIWAATTSELNGRTGHYFDTNSREAKLHPSAYDLEHQARIVDLLRHVAG